MQIAKEGTGNIPFLCLGHRTYIGYMYLQYTQNNAVLQTFVQLLQSSHPNLQRKRNTGTCKLSQESSSTDPSGMVIGLVGCSEVVKESSKVCA
jgi:hypothetical protein